MTRWRTEYANPGILCNAIQHKSNDIALKNPVVTRAALVNLILSNLEYY